MLRSSRSRQVCMTCDFFRHHLGPNCISLLIGHLKSGLIRPWRAPQPPLSPQEGWISDGRQLLHFRSTRWDRWCQELEVITGELLPGEAVPLLRHRREIYREAAIRLWGDKRKVGWVLGRPQW